MSQLSLGQDAPLTEVCVAIDLETTGLSSERDEIIEVGAVKFQGQRLLGTYQSLVNPYRQLLPFITSLTGIRQVEVDQAPPFAAVAGELEAFLGDAAVVGHNVAFDLGFLARKGIHVSAPVYDTWDLASVLLPTASDLSLVGLCTALKLLHRRPHRALEDAEATFRLLVALVEEAQRVLGPAMASELHQLASRSGWALRPLLGALEVEAHRRATAVRLPVAQALDLEGVVARLAAPPALEEGRARVPLDEEEVRRIFAPEGPLAQTFPVYEYRPQQVELALRVARTLNEGGPLLAEGGTGVGKSLAYLVPALLLALRNGTRVVVSTNTINLQEQLITKDIPRLLEALKGYPEVDVAEVQVSVLKGRANYLCLQRLQHLRGAASLTPDEARVLAKTLLWLRTTESGDRTELGLGGSDFRVWRTLCADGTYQCGSGGPCFLRAARQRAEAAHLLVINHALLLSDVARGGALLPPYRYLVVDEAHHLEEEATRQFGFRVSQTDLEELVEALSNPRGTAVRVREVALAMDPTAARRRDLERLAQQLLITAGYVQERTGTLFQLLYAFLTQHASDGDRRLQLSITTASRIQPAWSDVEIAWERVDGALAEVERTLEDLHLALDTDPASASADASPSDALLMDFSGHLQTVQALRHSLLSILSQPEEDTVYWLALEGQEGVLTLNAAPLDVGPLLEQELFSQKEAVVLTGATLSIEGSFAHIQQRLGLEEAQECLLGSPFDYHRSVLLYLPRDMPEPTDSGYMPALAQALVELGVALEGRVLALFTSHAALQATRETIRGPLEGVGVGVLGQGVDGSPPQLLRSFMRDARAVLLGTASFWEGVDIPDGLLKGLVLVRLPFNVPTDPLFAARSELYEDGFHQYAVPQAVLRFRQGFGRLIRRQEDRGVVLVLDRRITSRAYGQAFLNSIPPCTVVQGPLREVSGQAVRWIGG